MTNLTRLASLVGQHGEFHNYFFTNSSRWLIYYRFIIDNLEEDSEKRRYPNDDAYEQLTCPAGTRVAYRRCILCSPGSYSDTDDSVTCTHCSGNTIASSSGSTECTECPAGYIAIQRVRCDLPCAAPTDAPVAPPSPVVAPTRPTRPTRPIYSPFCHRKDGCYELEPVDEPEKVK